MIYKTTDGGLTWTKVPFDWKNATGNLVPYIEDKDPKRPYFSPIKDAIVDGLGQLHFSTFVYPAYSNHIDSLDYYWGFTERKGLVFNTYLTNGDQDAVSFAVTFVVAKDNKKETTLIEPGTSNAITWNERFQMGKSIDGMNIVFSWLDTDSTKFNDIQKAVVNNYPNVHITMLNVAEETIGPEINLTGEEENDFFDMCYWMFLSNDIIEKPGDMLFVPISVSSLAVNSGDPIEHYFFNNIYIDKTTGELGVNEESSIISETSIYPNPTSGNVNISFNDNARGKYNINVFNAIGSLVYSESIDVNSSVIRTINLEEMPNGIYMVQISNDKSTNTQKVIKN